MIFKVFDNLVPGGWAEFQEWSVGECIVNTSFGGGGFFFGSPTFHAHFISGSDCGEYQRLWERMRQLKRLCATRH